MTLISMSITRQRSAECVAVAVRIRFQFVSGQFESHLFSRLFYILVLFLLICRSFQLLILSFGRAPFPEDGELYRFYRCPLVRPAVKRRL